MKSKMDSRPAMTSYGIKIVPSEVPAPKSRCELLGVNPFDRLAALPSELLERKAIEQQFRRSRAKREQCPDGADVPKEASLLDLIDDDQDATLTSMLNGASVVDLCTRKLSIEDRAAIDAIADSAQAKIAAVLPPLELPKLAPEAPEPRANDADALLAAVATQQERLLDLAVNDLAGLVAIRSLFVSTVLIAWLNKEVMELIRCRHDRSKHQQTGVYQFAVDLLTDWASIDARCGEIRNIRQGTSEWLTRPNSLVAISHEVQEGKLIVRLTGERHLKSKLAPGCDVEEASRLLSWPPATMTSVLGYLFSHLNQKQLDWLILSNSPRFVAGPQQVSQQLKQSVKKRAAPDRQTHSSD